MAQISTQVEPSPPTTPLLSIPPLDELFHRLSKYDSEWLDETLRARWEHLVQGRAKESSDAAPSILQQAALFSHDLTIPRLPDSFHVSAFTKEWRARDWSLSPLGPMSAWSLDMRRAVNLCLHCEQPVVLWLGPEHVMMYNEAYLPIIGTRHPRALGRAYREAWPELDEGVQGLLDACYRYGTHYLGDNSTFVIESRGFREEIQMSFCLIPIADTASGGILGSYCTVQYRTNQEALSRRMSTLLTLGHTTAQARDPYEDFWKQLLRGIEANHTDIPFAAIYSFPKDPSGKYRGSLGDSDTASVASGSSTDGWDCVLSGSLGIPAGVEVLPRTLNSVTATELFTSAFKSSLSSGKILILSHDTFPSILSGFARHRTHGDPCRTAVLFPISPAHREDIYGFVLLGVNPLATYDSDYEEFVRLLQRQCATSLASIVLIEEEKRHAIAAAHAAAQDRIKLANKLYETQQAVMTERTKFMSMADASPVAMFQLDERGQVLYANKKWIDLSQYPADEWNGLSWMDKVHADDANEVQAQLAKVLSGEPVSFQMRWRTEYSRVKEIHINGEQVVGPTWTIATAYTERHPDGSIKGVLGSITDISQQKWIEGFQERRVREALELKRIQESFMDMICHEARNPLSAMMLCTEAILSTMQKLTTSSQTGQAMITKSEIDQQIDAAENLMACAQHQKRIIDDVLTLSKLGAKLLTISPIRMQPIAAIKQALKMLEVEMSKHDIQSIVTVHESYYASQIEWLRLDSSRLLQILINLLTNAIKFTQGRPERRLQVTLAASATPPSSSLSGVHYITESPSPGLLSADMSQPGSRMQTDVDGEEIYLAIEVIDSGAGIKPDEMHHLFQKFKQASPRTHVQYGGSGLGLFISQQLATMLGGAIGASSGRVDGKAGTTFAFYVKAPRCSAPDNTMHEPSSLDNTTPLQNVSIANHESMPSPEIYQMGRSKIRHVLVVEDNLINQTLLQNQLMRLGYEVSVANNGIEALEHILQSHFCKPHGLGLDIVLCDVEMPVCDGLECARRLREMQRRGQIAGHIPMVGVTANARHEQQTATLNAGMDTILTKPFRVAQLEEVLHCVEKQFYG